MSTLPKLSFRDFTSRAMSTLPKSVFRALKSPLATIPAATSLRHSSTTHSPLCKHLIDTIKISGPISLSHYMKTCLLHPTHGYYMHRDVFGTKGDFTTSPEISQMFGELLGVFFTNYWKAKTKTNGNPLSLLELGYD
jgi:hypothetical protein